MQTTIRLSRPHCCVCDCRVCHHIGVILCDDHRLGTKREG